MRRGPRRSHRTRSPRRSPATRPARRRPLGSAITASSVTSSRTYGGGNPRRSIIRATSLAARGRAGRRAEVDRHRGRSLHGVAGRSPSAHGRGQSGQRAGEAAVIGERQELRGHQKPALGVRPAYRALPRRRRRRWPGPPWAGSGRRAGRPRARRAARRPVRAGAGCGGRAPAGRPRGRCAALGLVHRDVGALEQAGASRRARGRARCRCWRRVHADPADGERAPRARAQPRRRRWPSLVAGVEHDGELVAAEPRQRVARAQRLLQARAELAQHLVAGVVAERVVELLEAVEVDQQQRDLVLACRATPASSRDSRGGGCRAPSGRR